MNSPQRDVMSPLTGLEHLARALAVPDPVTRARHTWQAVQTAEAGAVDVIARDVLTTLVTPRGDLEPQHIHQLDLVRSTNALEVFRALHRALACAPQTLTALAKGTPSPVHGAERRGLVAAVRRPLISAGYEVDEATARKVTYAVVAAVGTALAAPARIPVPPPRAGAAPLCDGPLVDHDDVDWLTGEPKPNPCEATRAALAALTVATSAPGVVAAA